MPPPQNRSFHFHLFRKVQIRLVGQERVALALDECPIFLTDAFIFPAPNLVQVVRRVFRIWNLSNTMCAWNAWGRTVGRLLFAGLDVPLPSDQAPWTDIISEHFVRDGRARPALEGQRARGAGALDGDLVVVRITDKTERVCRCFVRAEQFPTLGRNFLRPVGKFSERAAASAAAVSPSFAQALAR